MSKRDDRRTRRRAREARRLSRLSGSVPRPTRGPGEVFVTGGKCYHDDWCAAINGVWLSGAETLHVVPRASVRGKRRCDLCDDLAEGVHVG